MTQRLFICTDLDRTLIPNGPQSEPRGARECFARLAARPGVVLAYVSGRHRALVEKGIANYKLPVPDFIIGDVGTTIYHVEEDGDWVNQSSWQEGIGRDWAGKTHAELKGLLGDLNELRIQEHTKQNRHKLSYYVPLHCDRDALSSTILERMNALGVHSNLIWSVDEPEGVGLLDILPARASKLHAIEYVMRNQGFDDRNTIFCGDSGNDIEVLVSHIPSVLVANAEPEVKRHAQELAFQGGHADRLYVARGGFHGMNGNYSGGILEGIAHFHPAYLAWMGFDDNGGGE